MVRAVIPRTRYSNGSTATPARRGSLTVPRKCTAWCLPVSTWTSATTSGRGSNPWQRMRAAGRGQRSEGANFVPDALRRLFTHHASPITMTKYLATILAFTTLGCGFAANAQQNYPSRPVRIVVFVPAGGGADLLARVMGQKLGEVLGQTVVIDNRAGMGGVVGTSLV